MFNSTKRTKPIVNILEVKIMIVLTNRIIFIEKLLIELYSLRNSDLIYTSVNPE